MSRRGDWIQTYTGRQFWPLDPRPEDICIEDIAHALSLLCRYGGHCKDFYSVAQHSVIVSCVVPGEDALYGLLHDASEAYLIDLPRPLKRYSDLGTLYRQVENPLQEMIYRAFGLFGHEPQTVKDADRRMIATEARDLMAPLHPDWTIRDGAYPGEIRPIIPRLAERLFLDRFYALIPKAAGAN